MTYGPCLNPPCSMGGIITAAGGKQLHLRADVEVQGVGDNRTVTRDGVVWWSIYNMPGDFVTSDSPATPGEVAIDWVLGLAPPPQSLPPMDPVTGHVDPTGVPSRITPDGTKLFGMGLLAFAAWRLLFPPRGS